MDNIEFPTPICPVTVPHVKHRIEGTWREQCPGIIAGAGDPDRMADYDDPGFNRLVYSGAGMEAIVAEDCPQCQSRAGVRCHTMRGQRRWISGVHLGRVERTARRRARAALAAGDGGTA